jgi:hypothetical protein
MLPILTFLKSSKPAKANAVSVVVQVSLLALVCAYLTLRWDLIISKVISADAKWKANRICIDVGIRSCAHQYAATAMPAYQ